MVDLSKLKNEGIIIRYYRLKNIPLMDTKTGTIRGRRCNLLSFYCICCDRIHEMERKDVVVIDYEDGEQHLLCYESVKDVLKN